MSVSRRDESLKGYADLLRSQLLPEDEIERLCNAAKDGYLMGYGDCAGVKVGRMEPTDAEKILLKVVDLQAKHMDNSLSTFLYNIDTKELLEAQKEAYRESVCKEEVFWTNGHAQAAHFEAGWATCWQAVCTIAETQGGR